MSDELQLIPGIGPSMAKDLRDLGIFELADLQGQDPEMMYKRMTCTSIAAFCTYFAAPCISHRKKNTTPSCSSGGTGKTRTAAFIKYGR